MRKYFASQIKNKKALRKEECELFLEKFSKDFSNMGWLKVKTFIFNEYRLK